MQLSVSSRFLNFYIYSYVYCHVEASFYSVIGGSSL